MKCVFPDLQWLRITVLVNVSCCVGLVPEIAASIKYAVRTCAQTFSSFTGKPGFAAVWNSLSAKCRNCLGLTVETFRKHLKAHLFETAFMTTA